MNRLSPVFAHAAASAIETLAASIPVEQIMVAELSGVTWAIRHTAGPLARDLPVSVTFGDEMNADFAATRTAAQRGAPWLHPTPDSSATFLAHTIDGRSGVSAMLCVMDSRLSPEELAAYDLVVQTHAQLLGAINTLEEEVRAERSLARAAQALALLDQLTKLPNRRSWDRTVAQEEARCNRYGTECSVLVLDLDGLKLLNDERGHGEGDALLKRMAEALGSSLRTSDFVARLGGDEFGVLLIETPAESIPTTVELLRRRLLDRGIHASIGGAARSQYNDLITAWHAADLAMYANKRDTRAFDDRERGTRGLTPRPTTPRPTLASGELLASDASLTPAG